MLEYLLQAEKRLRECGTINSGETISRGDVERVINREREREKTGVVGVSGNHIRGGVFRRVPEMTFNSNS